jgi:hypothetical protein
MMAMNTIISTPAWSVVAAAPRATPSAVHRRRDDLNQCLFLLLSLQSLNIMYENIQSHFENLNVPYPIKWFHEFHDSILINNCETSLKLCAFQKEPV